MITPEKLAEWKAADQTRTQGRWEAPDVGGYCDSVIAGDDGWIGYRPHGAADAAFIVAASVAMPALLAEVDELREQRAKALQALSDLRCAIDTALLMCVDPQKSMEWLGRFKDGEAPR